MAEDGLRRPLLTFLRASSLHIGAAAAAASIRQDLVVEENAIDAADFDAAFAIARITPGTNLLALYVLLGHRLGGWRLALQALAVGVLIPAAVALVIAFAYVSHGSPVVALAMQGARAGALAVLLGAAVRLIRPQLVAHRGRGIAFAALGLLAGVALPAHQAPVLLTAGVLGALVLRSPK